MSFKFCSLSSGSSGNCQYIEAGNTRILIDAGFSGKRIETLLSSIDVCPKTLDAVFVTHEHIDHSSGIGVLSRRYGIPIYANENTWIGMTPIIKAIKEENTKVFSTDNPIEVKDLTVHPFLVSHDAREPVGYLVYYKNIKISIITDTGWVNEEMKNKIKNSQLYFMESNHDVKMLREGSYPWSLKQRIMSNKGHLSNHDAGEILGEVLSGNNEIVLLGHLSQDNNIPQLAYDTVRESVYEQGLDADNYIRLGMSFRDKSTCIYTL